MAKRIGQLNESTGRVEVKKVKRCKTTEIPWTEQKKTKAGRFLYSLVK